MKSNKQRRAEIMARRDQRKARSIKPPARVCFEREALAVDPNMLPPPGSYRAPPFSERGYYLPHPFKCKCCGKEEIWTAAQQKWWYEKALGNWSAVAVRCRACRAEERVRKMEARATSLAGFLKKQQQKIKQHETSN
jgi:Probable zinc-ribbon domain